MQLSNLIILALVAGVFIPLQTGVNAQLSKTLGQPLLASLASFAVGSLALLTIVLASGVKLPGWAEISQGSWFQWTGGLFGAFFVTAMVLLAPRLGVATTVALVIAGQMLGSLLIDHFGLMGFSVHAASVWRVAGAVLMIAGVALIQRF